MPAMGWFAERYGAKRVLAAGVHRVRCGVAHVALAVESCRDQSARRAKATYRRFPTLVPANLKTPRTTATSQQESKSYDRVWLSNRLPLNSGPPQLSCARL